MRECRIDAPVPAFAAVCDASPSVGPGEPVPAKCQQGGFCGRDVGGPATVHCGHEPPGEVPEPSLEGGGQHV